MPFENAEAPCCEHEASENSGSVPKLTEQPIDGMAPGVNTLGAMPTLDHADDVPESHEPEPLLRLGAEVPARLSITLAEGGLPEAVDQCEALLMQLGLSAAYRVFQRNGVLVHIITLPSAANCEGVKRQAGSVIVRTVDRVYLQDILGRLGRFKRYDARKKETKAVDVPKSIPEALLSRTGLWLLPVLRGLHASPTLRADGTLLATEGFDATSGYYIASKLAVKVPPRPTRKEAVAGLKTLKKLLAGFSFVGDVDLAVALALLLTGIIRPAVENVPLIGVTAPVRGSGKSTLAEIAAILATGRRAVVVAAVYDPDELRKRLEACLLAGDTLVILDNLNGVLHSDLLCQATTQPSLKVRPLGVSVQVEVQNTTMFCVNGNNLSISGDLARRTLICRLDPHCERPEEREFVFDPVKEALERRSHYVSAALTLLRGYIVAAPRMNLSKFGSFEGWSDLVRSALVWAGAEDPCESRAAVIAEDPELAALEAVLTAWFEKFGPKAMTVQQVMSEAERDDDSELNVSVSDIAEVRGFINKQRFGLWCRRNVGRIAGGRILERCAIKGASAHWRVVDAQAAGRGVAATDGRPLVVPNVD